LEKFQWWLGDKEISTNSVREFIVYLQTTTSRWNSNNPRANRKVNQTTVQRYWTGLSVFFNWCVREGFFEISPMVNMRKPKIAKKVMKGLENGDMAKLLNISGRSLIDYRNKAILMLFLDSGLRLSELASLKLDDISLKQGTVKVYGKGAKERITPMGIKTRKAVWNYLARRNGDGLWGITADGIAQMVKDSGRKVGLDISPHKLRHTFAISFLRNGANAFEVQRSLGHSTLEMTRRYCQALGDEDVIKRHRVSSPVDKL